MEQHDNSDVKKGVPAAEKIKSERGRRALAIQAQGLKKGDIVKIPNGFQKTYRHGKVASITDAKNLLVLEEHKGKIPRTNMDTLHNSWFSRVSPLNVIKIRK